MRRLLAGRFLPLERLRLREGADLDLREVDFRLSRLVE